MPNWCSNVVEVAHTDPTKLKALVDAFKEGKFCNFAIPVPEDLQIVAGCVGADTDPEQIKLVEAENRNLEKYGVKNWYDFCVARWGTKWDVSDEYGHELKDGETATTISFESAWAPPTGVYEALVEQGYQVRAYYYEPGMCFAGTWDNGDDDYYEFGGMSADEVAEEMPELDEVFGISESMREYEEQEEE